MSQAGKYLQKCYDARRSTFEPLALTFSLRDIRLLLGMSAREFSDFVEARSGVRISHTSLVRYETGARKASASNVEAIITALRKHTEESL
jgi:hypothetical protein